eukprot:gene1901-2243_t
MTPSSMSASLYQEGYHLQLSTGSAHRQKQVILGSIESADIELQVQLQSREKEIQELKEEIQFLRSNARGSEGQILLLQFQLHKLQQSVVEMKALPASTMQSPSSNLVSGGEEVLSQRVVAPTPDRQAWLLHWQKSRRVLGSLLSLTQGGGEDAGRQLLFQQSPSRGSNCPTEWHLSEEDMEYNCGGSAEVEVESKRVTAMGYRRNVTVLTRGEDMEGNELGKTEVQTLRRQLAVQTRVSALMESRLRQWMEMQIESIKSEAEREVSIKPESHGHMAQKAIECPSLLALTTSTPSPDRPDTMPCPGPAVTMTSADAPLTQACVPSSNLNISSATVIRSVETTEPIEDDGDRLGGGCVTQTEEVVPVQNTAAPHRSGLHGTSTLDVFNDTYHTTSLPVPPLHPGTLPPKGIGFSTIVKSAPLSVGMTSGCSAAGSFVPNVSQVRRPLAELLRQNQLDDSSYSAHPRGPMTKSAAGVSGAGYTTDVESNGSPWRASNLANQSLNHTSTTTVLYDGMSPMAGTPHSVSYGDWSQRSCDTTDIMSGVNSSRMAPPDSAENYYQKNGVKDGSGDGLAGGVSTSSGSGSGSSAFRVHLEKIRAENLLMRDDVRRLRGTLK